MSVRIANNGRRGIAACLIGASIIAVGAISIQSFTLTPSAFAQGKPNATQAVDAFVAKFLDTYNKKDAAGVAALYAEDGVLLPPGPMTTGKANIEKVWRAAFDAGRTGLKYQIQQISADGNLVWAIGQFTVMAPDEKGTLQERGGNFSNIYQWDGNELRFRVHAFSFFPPPK